MYYEIQTYPLRGQQPGPPCARYPSSWLWSEIVFVDKLSRTTSCVGFGMPENSVRGNEDVIGFIASPQRLLNVEVVACVSERLFEQW